MNINEQIRAKFENSPQLVHIRIYVFKDKSQEKLLSDSVVSYTKNQLNRAVFVGLDNHGMYHLKKKKAVSVTFDDCHIIYKPLNTDDFKNALLELTAISSDSKQENLETQSKV